jgi:hypothetical protein
VFSGVKARLALAAERSEDRVGIQTKVSDLLVPAGERIPVIVKDAGAAAAMAAGIILRLVGRLRERGGVGHD